MSIRNRAILIAALILSSVTIASSDGIFNPGSLGVGDNGISRVSGLGTPPPSGKLLLADGTSFILATDGTSKICRAGGC